MTGAQELMAARMRGYRTPAVWINLLTEPLPKKSLLRAEKSIELGFAPSIDVLPGEHLTTLDFTCVAGLVVHIISEPGSRAVDLIDRLTNFEPAGIVLALPECIVVWTEQAGLTEMRIR